MINAPAKSCAYHSVTESPKKKFEYGLYRPASGFDTKGFADTEQQAREAAEQLGAEWKLDVLQWPRLDRAWRTAPRVKASSARTVEQLVTTEIEIDADNRIAMGRLASWLTDEDADPANGVYLVSKAVADALRRTGVRSCMLVQQPAGLIAVTADEARERNLTEVNGVWHAKSGIDAIADRVAGAVRPA